jgi:acyl-coenzyme A thioesterase PaaI-like protein
VEPLLNSRWGFESNCFVCEAANTEGLRIPFLHDAEQRRVVAGFELDDRFSGAPSYVHGGIVLAVLDEAMAWAAIAVAGVFAVTKETTTRFRRPVRVGTRYEVRGWVEEDGEQLRCGAEVVDAGGERCAVASATFVALGPAQAADAIGADVPEADRGFVRGATAASGADVPLPDDQPRS